MPHLVGLHRQAGDEREEDDYYASHPAVVVPLMKFLGWVTGGKLIRENSCGEGHLSIPMQLYGHTVISSDLIDRGFGLTGIDFLKDSWLDDAPYDAVVMNPPYDKKVLKKFILKSLKIAPVVCAFLRLTFLESDGRQELFKKNPPKWVLVFVNRAPSSKGGKFIKKNGKKEVSSVCYAWFIWERGYKGDPMIKWIWF